MCIRDSVAAVADWMQSNCLQLNDNKTVMWCTTGRRQHRLPTAGPTIGSFSATPASTVRDLGVYIDSDLSMRSHVRRTVPRCFATLRQLRTIWRQVPTSVFQSLMITALVLPHLDYCNSVLYGLPSAHLTSVCTECYCAAHIRYTAFRAHLTCAQQPSLAAHP